MELLNLLKMNDNFAAIQPLILQYTVNLQLALSNVCLRKIKKRQENSRSIKFSDFDVSFANISNFHVLNLESKSEHMDKKHGIESEKSISYKYVRKNL